MMKARIDRNRNEQLTLGWYEPVAGRTIGRYCQITGTLTRLVKHANKLGVDILVSDRLYPVDVTTPDQLRANHRWLA